MNRKKLGKANSDSQFSKLLFFTQFCLRCVSYLLNDVRYSVADNDANGSNARRNLRIQVLRREKRKIGEMPSECRLFSRDHERSSIREITQKRIPFSAYDRRTNMHMRNSEERLERLKISQKCRSSQDVGSRSNCVLSQYREITGDTQWNSRACVNRMILLCISNIVQNNKISS